ncbi:orexin [Osmerus mordax]|uniref:orexin n=1 Tax=Osmerus mordax TaxID=8014 RepID=UPI00350ED681
MWFSPMKLQTTVATGVEPPPTRKLKLLLLVLLVSHLACDAQDISECCRQNHRTCRLYVLLCRPGSGARGVLVGDAAAGILTLGKRNGEEQRFQSRLNQLLHGSRNQAAGILTMGKRTAEYFLMPVSATVTSAALAV